MSRNTAYERSWILWPQIWNHIFNMKLLWRHHDVIFEKLVKQQASWPKIHLFIDSVSKIILFLVHISPIAHLCVQNVWKIAENWDLICYKSWHYVDDIIKARETSIILIPTVSIKNNINGKPFFKVLVGPNKRWRSSSDFKIDPGPRTTKIIGGGCPPPPKKKNLNI